MIVHSIRTRALVVTPIRLSLGVALLIGARIAGAANGPALLAFALGALGIVFVVFNDPRARFAHGDVVPLELPDDRHLPPAGSVRRVTGYLATAAATWGVAMALSPLLQIRKIRAHRSSREVSIVYQQVLLVGFILWFSYGIALHNIAIIIPNVVAGIVATATILVTLHYR